MVLVGGRTALVVVGLTLLVGRRATGPVVTVLVGARGAVVVGGVPEVGTVPLGSVVVVGAREDGGWLSGGWGRVPAPAGGGGI